MKLATVMKELSETKNLLLEKYAETDVLRDTNARLRQLNAKLSKEVKILKDENLVLLDKQTKLREDFERLLKKVQKSRE